MRRSAVRSNTGRARRRGRRRRSKPSSARAAPAATSRCCSPRRRARFVSGYLYDPALDGGEAVQGAGATHAWADIYLPGAGWVEFDPTNALVACENLIRVAVTRDPSQAIPIGGTFSGEGAEYLGMEVDVTVTAEERG